MTDNNNAADENGGVPASPIGDWPDDAIPNRGVTDGSSRGGTPGVQQTTPLPPFPAFRNADRASKTAAAGRPAAGPNSTNPEATDFPFGMGAQPSAGIGSFEAMPESGNPAFATPGVPDLASKGAAPRTREGFAGPSAHNQYPAFSPTTYESASYSGSAFEQPKKPKRSWTTAALAAATMAGIIVGGLIGGLAGYTLGDQSDRDDVSGYEQPDTRGDQPTPAPSMPSANGHDTTAQQGKRVDSAPGVVLVNSAYDRGQGAGTGMIVDSSGIVLTNYHVVHGSNEVAVTIADSGKEYTATVIGHNASKDVAVLQIKDAPKFKTVKISSKEVKKGDVVSAIGNGSGQGYLTSLEGKVTGTDLSINAQDELNKEDVDRLEDLIQTDADVVQGYSGGPLMNAKGEVVGVTTAASTGTTSDEIYGYAIPIEDAMDVVKQVRSGKAGDGVVIGRNAALGVTVVNNQNGQGAKTKGAAVREVNKGSGAEAAGIKPGDVITHLDGDEVSSPTDLSDGVQKHDIGDTVTLTVVGSDGQTRDVKVKLGESSVN